MKIELQKITKNDAQSIFNSWGRNPENFLYLSAQPQKNIDDTQHYLDNLLVGDNIAFHIVEISTKKVVGHMKAMIDGHKALIGYVVDKPYWGQGIATQALNNILKILRSKPGIARIWATCAVENVGSIKVLEKCGFKKEGLLSNWIVYPAQGSHPQDNYAFCFDPKHEIR